MNGSWNFIVETLNSNALLERFCVSDYFLPREEGDPLAEQKLIENWEHFFKPEVRSSGRTYFVKGQVASSQPSDTEIQAYIRGSTSFRVSLKSESMESPLITVDCTCPSSKKGQLCKHIWATLLKVEESHADFLDGKSEIEKRQSPSPASAQASKASPSFGQPKPLSQSQIDSQAAYKAKQAEYRKQQYEKQKQRLKEQKQVKKKSKFHVEPSFPEDVASALAFFSQNGFELQETLDADSLRLAKKKLSRVFHPDIGGSHGEIVTLNENYQVLLGYIESQG